MVIQHNNTELTRVRPSPGVKQHSVYFHYTSEEEQLLAAIDQSEHCQQELSYHCRKSRLLNTQGNKFDLTKRAGYTCHLIFTTSLCHMTSSPCISGQKRAALLLLHSVAPGKSEFFNL